ncbi:DUF1573 domain-containing protein [Sphingobacterium sp. BN32]|uniref:DUF1573 domain-containing protein n=1 Tax=Sphingobacterium sp. BN32 TaxID=3058432 RepID=UPI00265CB69F|nr:DUF1573 domain-containing protein [Sphingobacterium sp. BN32]WKK58546.1 DUF1573 domain-containing protein [Sphingobacterium sp. BN32]
MKTLLNICWIACILLTVGCKTPTQITSMEIEDSVRTYLPILQGDKQDIIVKVKNTGKTALKIEDVLPSCACTDAKILNNLIPPGKTGYIQMKFDSNKNIGYAGVYTTIVANTPQKYHTLFFEINVVPDANKTLDYEEIYRDNLMSNKFYLREANKGKSLDKNYVTY